MLAASGLIAGEALTGLFIAAVVGFRAKHEFFTWTELFTSGTLSSIVPWMAIPVALYLVWYLIAVPLRKAGAADEPAPPTAVM